MGLQVIGHNQSIWDIQILFFFMNLRVKDKQFEVWFIKIGAILDFDSLYKFEMTFWPIILCNLKTKHRRYIKLYIFWILHDKTNNCDTICREIGACFNFRPIWNSQGQWRPSWKCHNMWHIRKMLFMLLLNSVQSLTVLTFCAQWMALAALLELQMV